MDSGKLEPLLEKLRELFESEYERGAKDALRRIVDVAQGTSRAGTKSSKGGRKRAPRGAARALVERVLKEQKGGASVPFIISAASSPVEKSVSGSAIRLELYRGKKERRYRANKGKWSLPAKAA